MSRLLLMVWILGSALVVGCGGSKDSDPYGFEGCEDGCGCDDGCDDGCGEEEESSGGGTYSEAVGTAGVKGTVTFDGKAPRRRAIDMGSEQFCVDTHPEKVLSETYMIGEGGAMQNVIVYVKSGLKGWKFPAPTGMVELDQEGCTYIPHVFGMRVGQTLKIKNSDPIMHNVHGFDLKTKRDLFNIGQPKKGTVDEIVVKRAGFVQIKCDVHGWMGSYAGVFNHPFFTVSSEDGSFSLDKLPPGKYVIEAWHEKLGTKSETVTVGDGETKEISFSFTK